MSNAPKIKVIETKRKPPLWAVKVGARYKASYLGDDARAKAIQFAEMLGSDYELVEKQMTKRERARVDSMEAMINKKQTRNRGISQLPHNRPR